VPVLQKALGGRISLDERQVAGQPEPCRAPRGDELVGLRPTVEAHAEGVAAQHAKDFRERRLEPRAIAIIGYRAPIARTVMRQIRRIGQHEINARTAEAPHHFDAIALRDCVLLRRAADWFALLFIHFSSLLRVGMGFLHPGDEEPFPARRELAVRGCFCGTERVATRVTRAAFANGARVASGGRPVRCRACEVERRKAKAAVLNQRRRTDPSCISWLIAEARRNQCGVHRVRH